MGVVSEASVQLYRQALEKLGPRGAAWKVKPEGVLEKVLSALAAELAKFGEVVSSFLTETDPYQASELLPEWESALSLPSDCTGPLPSAALRRFAVVQRLTSNGPRTIAEFEALAASLGYDVDITLNNGWEVGISTCNDPMASHEWFFVWDVHAPVVTPIFAQAESAQAGDPIMVWSNELLECVFRDVAPAHTTPRFVYDGFYDGYAPWGTWLTPAPATAGIDRRKEKRAASTRL